MTKKYIDIKWHYPQKGEYPVIYGEYEHKHYPQIPCLVFHRGMYGVRFWNCTEECWDDEECDDFYCSKEEVEKWMYIDSLQQEQSIKVYRVENEKEQKGLWRKFDGTWEPLFDMLTDGQCKDVPMDDSQIYREGGKQWFASAPSKKTLQKWFSKRDLEELTVAGFTITEFEVTEYRKLSDFEYIFTRESIVNKTNINIVDIYPQEQPSEDLEEAAEEYSDNNEYMDVGFCVEPVYIGHKMEKAFIAGAKWQEQQNETMKADTLEELIEYLSKRFDVSYAKLARIVVKTAKWQKEQMLKDAVERTVKIDSGGYPYIDITAELYDYDHDVPLAKEGELVKIIIVPQEEE